MITTARRKQWISLIGALLGTLLAVAPAYADVGVRASTFEDVVARLSSQASDGTRKLAASLTPQGHWQLANSAGERMTAADQDELTRALAILLPNRGDAAEPLSVLMAEDALYRGSEAAAQLPEKIIVRVLVGGTERRVVRAATARRPSFAFEMRPRLLVTAESRATLVEFDRLLARPLERTRILALETSGGGVLPPRPPRATEPGSPVVEPIDPERIVHALHALTRQTVIITGRIEGDRLHVRPSSGSGRWLPLANLLAAARASDIDLIIVTTESGRQPGGRNWLWQKIELRNLRAATERPSLADFMHALVGDRLMTLAATHAADARITLTGVMVRDAADVSWTTPITDTIIDLAAESVGIVQASGLRASLLGTERRDELTRRILPGVPSHLQFGYLALLAVGLLGWPVAQQWWARAWPPEQRTEYAHQSGYRAAVIVRLLIAVFMFAPLVAPASSIVQLATLARRLVSGSRSS